MSEIAAIEVSVVRIDPSSSSMTVERARVWRPGEPAPKLGGIDPGTYGLIAYARSEDCRAVAVGQRMDIKVEACGESVISVPFERVSSDFPCEPSASCVRGACTGPTAGGDSGLDASSDAGSDAPSDAGLDAGSDAGLDAGRDADPGSAPEVTHITNFGGSQADRFVGVAADSVGVYTTGGWNDRSSVDESRMFLMRFNRFDLTAEIGPVTHAGLGSWGHDIEIDGAGTIVVSGYDSGLVRGKVVALNSIGEELWSLATTGLMRSASHVNGGPFLVGPALSVASSGQVYLADHYGSTGSLGSETLTGGPGIVVACRDDGATSVREIRDGSEAHDISVRPLGGAVFVIGHDPMSVRGFPLPGLSSPLGPSFGGAGIANQFSAAQAGSDRVWIAGFVEGMFPFDTASGPVVVGESGTTNLILVEFNPLSSLIERVQAFPGVYRYFDASSVVLSLALVLDGAENLHMAGVYSGTVNFGGEDLDPDGGIFLASFTSRGAHRYSTSLGGGRAVGIHRDSLTFGPDGTLYMAGMVRPGTTVAGRPLTGSGATDFFLARIQL